MKKIEIKTTKIIERGVAKRKIESVSALGRDELPDEYIDNKPMCYYIEGEEPMLWINPTPNLVVGKTYTEPTFQNVIITVKLAGGRLHKINNKIRALESEWIGSETFVI